jgi:hypothetical protein
MLTRYRPGGAAGTWNSTGPVRGRSEYRYVVRNTTVGATPRRWSRQSDFGPMARSVRSGLNTTLYAGPAADSIVPAGPEAGVRQPHGPCPDAGSAPRAPAQIARAATTAARPRTMRTPTLADTRFAGEGGCDCCYRLGNRSRGSRALASQVTHRDNRLCDRPEGGTNDETQEAAPNFRNSAAGDD